MLSKVIDILSISREGLEQLHGTDILNVVTRQVDRDQRWNTILF